jgi:hypothetical protein
MGAPQLEVRFEGPGALPRRRTFDLRPGGLVAAFDVPAGTRAVSLALRGGDPFLLRSIGLRRSTFPELAGLNMDERGRE